MTDLKLTVEYDSDATDFHDEYDGVEVYSFSNRHVNYKHPDSIENLEKDVEEGFAFLLSYFSHGGCVWSLRGEGPSCPWDSVDVAGVLILDKEEWKDEPVEKRENFARSLIQEYTKWCNGEIFGFSLSTLDKEIVDSCWGFFDKESLIESVKDVLTEKDKIVEFSGDAMEHEIQSAFSGA